MIIVGDCLEKLKGLEDNSVDAVVTDPCTLYGKYDTMGLWKHFGIKLKRQIIAGFGLVQITGLAMVKFVSKTKRFIHTDYPMSGLKEKSQKGIRLTTYVEFQPVATQTIWKRLLKRSMLKEGMRDINLLKLIV